MCRAVFSIKLQDSALQLYLKKDSITGVSLRSFKEQSSQSSDRILMTQNMLALFQLIGQKSIVCPFLQKLRRI